VTISTNVRPTAEANGPYSGVVGQPISFSAAGSSDPDGSIIEYLWDFQHGGSGSGVVVTKTFDRVGTVRALLSVTDNRGGSAADTATVTIMEPPNFAVKTSWLNSSGSSAPEVGQQAVGATYGNVPGEAGPGDLVALDVVTKPNVAAVRVQARVAWSARVLRYDSIRRGGEFDASYSATRPQDGVLDLVGESSDALPTNRETRLARVYFTVIGLEGDSTLAAPSNVALSAAGGVPVGDALPVLVSVLRVREGGPNQPPTAEAGGPYTGTTTVAVQFNGSGTDADGFIVRYSWDFGDGTRAPNGGPNPIHLYAQAGSYPVALTVFDNNGLRGTDLSTATITTGTPNQAPVARPGGPYSGTASSAVAFNGSTSSDADGTVAKFDWTWGDGQSSANAGATPSHVYASAGSYTVTLKVTDNQGATHQATAAVTITAVGTNPPPVANAGGPYAGVAGTAIAFNGSGSTDANGTITRYDWVWGDGQTSANAGATPAHTYAAAGTYTVTLTVTDNGGATDDATATVTVTAGGGGGNIKVRWVNASGAPITTASVGQTVKAQICTPLDLEAFAGKISFSSKLTYVNSVDLNSQGTGVHPNCVGTLDALNDFFTANPVAGSVTLGIGSIETTPSVGTVGIAEITFTVAGTGTETLQTTDFQMATRGGVDVTATFDVAPLTIQ
jgi:PKD repeat protein